MANDTQMEAPECKFGECKHYHTCGKKPRRRCKRFNPCKTYMDKYDNDYSIWEDLHGREYD